jgi:hypothetical protein
MLLSAEVIGVFGFSVYNLALTLFFVQSSSWSSVDGL